MNVEDDVWCSKDKHKIEELILILQIFLIKSIFRKIVLLLVPKINLF